MDATNTGQSLLASWRAQHGKSQSAVARALVPPITQAAVSKWETDPEQRPDLRRAVQLEGITGGAVPATAWGHPAEEIEALRAAFAFVAVPRDQGTENDSEPSGEAA